MESLQDPNCNNSMSDSFSLYERYLKSFNVVDNIIENKKEVIEQTHTISGTSRDIEDSNIACDIDLTTAVSSKYCESAATKHISPNSPKLTTTLDLQKEQTNLNVDLFVKIESSCYSPTASSLGTSITVESILNEKSNTIDVPISSDDSRQNFKQPVFITSTMENSNNAVDSVPMFSGVRASQSIFKLPIIELSFNGTIKHVKKLQPIVDPITALTSCTSGLVDLDEKSGDHFDDSSKISITKNEYDSDQDNCNGKTNVMLEDKSTWENDKIVNTSEIIYDLHDEEVDKKVCQNTMEKVDIEDGNSSKWNLEQSLSSFEASFDSGVRSPDMFSDDDADAESNPAPEVFWNFLKDYEARDKRKLKKLEETLQGVLPPPSVTILKLDVSEMLKKYYTNLPLLSDNVKNNTLEPKTPTKGVSFVEIPLQAKSHVPDVDVLKDNSVCDRSTKSEEADISYDKNLNLKMNTEQEAKESAWPDVLKCRYYDVYYNLTSYSEKLELLALRLGERYVGAETDTSVNVTQRSPNSASKRKAQRLKLSQVKSPGRRLSHLARRRQAFCSAATFSEKAQLTGSKMVLIDKNFFPHRKLVNSSEWKSPRSKRTPGKKTPRRKTPHKTPKTKSGGGSSRKKAVRRLIMDSENLTKSQPIRETLRRALFVSPENRKSVPIASSSSVPLRDMKSKRALFSSPIRQAETKSMDGTQSDHFLKRKRDALDDEPELSRNKIPRSLSFGGDKIPRSLSFCGDKIENSQSVSLCRRASEFLGNNKTGLDEQHKKKLLWAVSEALRAHGWRMSSPGFREKASALARLTRRLLLLPPHAARLASPHLSTSDTMLKLARQYVFAIIQERSVEECFLEEQKKLANESKNRLSGYISANAYQQIKLKSTSTVTSTSQIKENTCNEVLVKQEPRSATKNVLQDKLLNVDSSSGSSGVSLMDRSGFFKSNSMPSFEEAAMMRARRQISFDNIDFPKR